MGEYLNNCIAAAPLHHLLELHVVQLIESTQNQKGEPQSAPKRDLRTAITAQDRGNRGKHSTDQQHSGAGEVAEDVVPDALGDGGEVGVVAARVGVVVSDDGEALRLEVVLDEGERELERGEQREVVRLVGARHGFGDRDDGRGGGAGTVLLRVRGLAGGQRQQQLHRVPGARQLPALRHRLRRRPVGALHQRPHNRRRHR